MQKNPKNHDFKPKICIKYRKHWKSYVSFQPSGQIGQKGLIWAVLKLFSKLTAISPAKDIFYVNFQQYTEIRKSWGHPF